MPFTILESLIYGNAIYVFDKNWLEFSKLTKKEILDENLHMKRIIHKKGWEKEVRALSNFLWVVVLDCDFFVQDIAFVPSYSHVS